jgi:hypothetical protein
MIVKTCKVSAVSVDLLKSNEAPGTGATDERKASDTNFLVKSDAGAYKNVREQLQEI